jgi:hypothetical protein
VPGLVQQFDLREGMLEHDVARDHVRIDLVVENASIFSP